MKRIIILGSEGFIGSHLVKYFISLGYYVAGCDLFEGINRGYPYFKISRLSPEWDDVFSTTIYDYCINAAGSGNVPYSMSHPFIDFEANTLDTMRILDSIRRFNSKCRYLHISSAAVYGNPEILPIVESSSIIPLSPYGWHKLMAELICREFNTVYKISTVVVRPFSVYGPGLKKQLFWDIYQKVKINPQMIELWGTGEETRDFIYIDDLVACIAIITEKACMKGEIYNISSGEEITIKSAVESFLSCLEFSTQIAFNNHVREGDPLNWRADTKKIAEMGFVPKTPFGEGLKKLSNWLKVVENKT